MIQTNLFEMTPMDLMEYLDAEFHVDVPISIDSVDELQTAGTLLGMCASHYTYLVQQAMTAKLIKRTLKQGKADKSIVDDALSREEILSTFADCAKTSYNAISRMITVRSQAMEELKMLHGTP